MRYVLKMKEYIRLFWIFHAFCISSLRGFECFYKKNTVLHAHHGGKTSGSKAIVLDFHNNLNSTLVETPTCQLTVNDPGFTTFQLLATPQIENCNSEVILKKTLSNAYTCNYTETISRFYQMNRSTEIVISLKIKAQPFNSDYCIRITGSVMLNIHCYKQKNVNQTNIVSSSDSANSVIAPVVASVFLAAIVIAVVITIVIKRKVINDDVNKNSSVYSVHNNTMSDYVCEDDESDHHYDTLSDAVRENDVTTTNANDPSQDNSINDQKIQQECECDRPQTSTQPTYENFTINDSSDEYLGIIHGFWDCQK